AMAHPQAVPTGLAELGLPIEFFATYLVVVKVVFTAFFTTIAAVIFWRRADDWMALLLSLALLAFGASFPGTLSALDLAYPSLAAPVHFFNTVAFSGFFIFFYVFPDGRFVPRWTAILTALWFVIVLFQTLLPSTPLSAS